MSLSPQLAELLIAVKIEHGPCSIVSAAKMNLMPSPRRAERLLRTPKECLNVGLAAKRH